MASGHVNRAPPPTNLISSVGYAGGASLGHTQGNNAPPAIMDSPPYDAPATYRGSGFHACRCRKLPALQVQEHDL
jgi:hypothetical protein